MIPKFFLKRRHAAMHIWDLMHIDRNIKKEDVAKRRMCLFGRRKQPFFDTEVEEDN